MSGLRNSEDRFHYLNFSNGKIVTKEAGELETFDEFEGRLTDIKVVDDEYQGVKFKNISMYFVDDEAKKFLLNIRLDSGYGISFCMLVPNIELSFPFVISGFQKEIDGKKKSGIFVKQKGKFLKWYFTKKNPRDLPPLKKVKVKGNEVWDSSDQQNFFIKMLQEVAVVLESPVPEYSKDAKSLIERSAPIDDLPF